MQAPGDGHRQLGLVADVVSGSEEGDGPLVAVEAAKSMMLVQYIYRRDP